MPPLAVTRSGTGPPLVLLHGLGSSRRAWDPVLPALAARFDVIAVDLPGFGDSAPLYGEAEVPPARLAESQPAGLPLARPARDRTAVLPGEVPAGPGPGPRPDPRPARAADG